MKTSIKAIFLVIAVAACFTAGIALRGRVSNAQGANLSVAVVDVQYVMENFSGTVAANQKLEKLKVQKEDDLKSRIAQQFGTTDISQLDNQKRFEAERVLEEADKAFQSEANSLRASEWEPAVEKVMQVIQSAASQKGYEIVLGREAVLYGGEDITEAVLAELNKK